MTVDRARELDQSTRDAWLLLLKNSLIPQIEAKNRVREIGDTAEVSLFLKIRAKLTGRQYCIIPGVYCDVIRRGDGKRSDSVVECDLDLLEKGTRKLIRTLEKASE